jgi:hypothetical protein
MNRKPVIAIAAAALLLSTAAAADTYVKIESHTGGYYSGGTETPPEDSVTEIWVGDQRMSYLTDTSKLIVDQEKKKLIFVNLRDKTYAETELPLDMTKLFTMQDLMTLGVFTRLGTVEKGGEEKKIEKWNCSRYDMSDWIDYEGGRVSEREVTAWMTADVPFDVKKYNQMFSNLGKLSNLSDEYLGKLVAIPGFQVASEETRYQDGTPIRTTTSVVEMAQKEPPADAYALPEGATRKDALTLQDLR